MKYEMLNKVTREIKLKYLVYCKSHNKVSGFFVAKESAELYMNAKICEKDKNPCCVFDVVEIEEFI